MNCLADVVFENLLFMNVVVGGVKAVALFDSGAQKSVISERLLKKCKGEVSTRTVIAGNNNGHTMELKIAALKSVIIADKEVLNHEVLVVDDDAFDIPDSYGRNFPADMFLGYDVIGKFRWEYSAEKRILEISDTNVIAEEKTLTYSGFPLINVISEGENYVAGIDTGHTETILSMSVKSSNSLSVVTEDEIVGLGSKSKATVKVLREIVIEYKGMKVNLSDIAIMEKIYGASPETDLLLGMDFFEGKSWTLDFKAGVFELIN